MIMKLASGRAARVAKQQVGPHSALPYPGLPACPLRFASPLVPAAFTHSHTDTQNATACSCFWTSSPFVFVFGFGFVFVFRFCAAATRRGKFSSYAHLRSLRPFPALSLSLSHSLPATFVRSVPLLLLSCLSCAWKFPFCKFPFACDGRRALSAPRVLIRSWARSGFARECCSTISQRRRQTAKRSAIVDGVAGSGTACSV